VSFASHSDIVPWWEGPLPDKTCCRIIADSIAPGGQRLTTFEAKFHRFVLAELNTHTLFSRNSESSRAVPYKTKRANMLRNPALPLLWGTEKPGMQAGPPMGPEDEQAARELWLRAMTYAVGVADELTHFTGDLEENMEEGELDAIEWTTSEALHKSVANRLLEPFCYHTVTLSSVDWDGFFNQRSEHRTDGAQKEIAVLATMIEDLYNQNTPRWLDEGGWHKPYIRPAEEAEVDLLDQLRLSTARCARTSYLTSGGLRDVALDFKLYDTLRTNRPAHASPFQHPATPASWNQAEVTIDPKDYGFDGAPHTLIVPIVGNARGWLQLRHIEIGF